MVAAIVRSECFVCRAPIEKPVINAFGAMSERVAVFVRLTDADGVSGWGEIWSNFPTVGAEHRARLFHNFIAPRLIGRSIHHPAEFWAETDKALHLWGLQAGEPGAFAAALAGADIALHDLLARRAGVPLWRSLGGDDGGPVPVYASGLNPDAQALAQVEAARDDAHRSFKIKIGFGEARDLATLRPVFGGLKAGERVMVDINQGWDLRTATRMVQVLSEFPLTWIEEPLAADRPAWEWCQVAGASTAPLAAGENLRGTLEFHKALQELHLGFVQPDCCKWGGISATLPVARAIVASGRAYCPHFLAGGIGQLASLHLLAAVRGNGVLELDANPNPLRSELINPVIRIADGLAALPTTPGLGLDPEVEALSRFVALKLEKSA
jgi:L-alanine-DL-glutamate epimerase-like enolase superfamily enzyme